MENNIYLEGGLNYLIDDEISYLQYELNSVNIEITVSKEEKTVIKNSFLNEISVYINQNLTELFVNGMISPATYDVFKSSLMLIYNRITKRVHIVQSDDVREAGLALRFKTEKGEMSMTLSNGLSDNQFSMAMDSMKVGMAILAPDELEPFMIMEVKEDMSVQIKPLREYVREKKKVQK